MDPKPTASKDQKVATYSTRPPRFKKPGLALSRPQLSRRYSLVAILALLVFLLALIGGWLGAYTYDHNRLGSSSTTAQKQQVISDEGSLIASIAKDVGQSVVSVDVQSQTVTQDFFGFPQTSNQASSGTGFIVSSDGIIVTNRHVVPDDNSTVSVTLADGTKFDNVKIIGRTNSSSVLDVAFLKIQDTKGKKLIPAMLGDSSKMQVGDRVITIGNALGQFQNTVTSGIISGFGRDVQAGDQTGASTENLTDLFQTDAAINEGNSGGPLVNINGEVIGVNTAVASGAQNIGFAIPINDITRVGSTKLDDKTNLTSALTRYKVGDQVDLTVVRDGKTTHIKVTLENAPSS
jgi:S1-C subfamily serine protease